MSEYQPRYRLIFPSVPELPIILFECASDKRRQVTLREAKDIIFGAVLRGDGVISESRKVGFPISAVVSIIDEDTIKVLAQEWDQNVAKR